MKRKPSLLNWQGFGFTGDPVSLYSFIKKTESGKFWIDVNELENKQKATTRNNKVILIVFAVIFGAILLVIILTGLGMLASIPLIGAWFVGIGSAIFNNLR